MFKMSGIKTDYCIGVMRMRVGVHIWIYTFGAWDSGIRTYRGILISYGGFGGCGRGWGIWGALWFCVGWRTMGGGVNFHFSPVFCWYWRGGGLGAGLRFHEVLRFS